MAWSFRIGRLADIDIRLHATFALVLGFGAYRWGLSHGGRGAVFGALMVALLFVCVVLHELGHALVARRFGIPVDSIVLLPIGGVAQLARNPDNPRHELWIAAAGPAVNGLLALGLLLANVALGQTDFSSEALRAQLSTPSLSGLLLWLLAANVTMAVFNLLPALPMDGGRILRAALSMRMGPARATPIAASIGQVLALGLGVLGLLDRDITLVLIAAFVFFGAGQERAEQSARNVLASVRVGDAYNKHALTLLPGDRLPRVVEYLLTSHQPSFAVMLGSHLYGVVTRERALQALRSVSPDTYVAGLMERNVPRIDVDASLEDARRMMGEHRVSVLAVHRGEEFLGLVGLDNIAEAFTVASALTRPPARPGGLPRTA